MKRIIAVALIALLFTIAGCGRPDKEKTEVPNPMVEYKSLEEISKKMDYPMVELPEDMQYTLDKMYIISGNIVQLDYVDEAGDTSICLRKAKGNEDISGIYGVEYTQETLSGIPVNVGTYQDIHVAYFVYEDFSYSATAKGLTGVSFDNLLISLTGAIKAEKATPTPKPTESESAK